MKQGPKRGKPRSEENVSYTYSGSLHKYCHDWLQLDEKRESLKSAGQDLSPADKKQLKRLARRKVHVVDKKMFQSMANLIFILEMTSQYANLREHFENELKDLSGLRARKDNETLYPEFAGWTTRIGNSPFERLVSAFVDANRTHKDDYGLVLTAHLQNIVYDKSINSMYERIGKNLTSESARLVLKQAVGWINLLASSYEHDDNAPHRIIQFPAPYEKQKRKQDSGATD